MPLETAPRRRRRSRRTPWYRAWFTKTSPARLAVTLAILVVLAALAVHAGSLGLAHLQVLRVENDLKRWQQAGRLSSLQDLERALQAIDRAIQLHEDNPYQLTLRGRLLEWRAYTAEGESRAADYRTALALYRQAAALRPLWPDIRAEMINVKLNLYQLDGELDRLLSQADSLGPYTPTVHSAVVRAGFLLGRQDGPLFQRHILRGLQDRRSRAQIWQLVQQNAAEATVCTWLEQGQEPALPRGLCRNQPGNAVTGQSVVSEP